MRTTLSSRKLTVLVVLVLWLVGSACARKKAEEQKRPAAPPEKKAVQKDEKDSKARPSKKKEGTERPPATVEKKAEGLSLTFVTTSPGGNKRYEPKNILAVWVEDASGKFVRTLGRWAGRQKRNLTEWKKADGTDIDGVTGATQATYGTYTVKWDLRDRQGRTVADGKYRIRMELTNHNAKRNQFHRLTLIFEKSGKAAEQKIDKKDGFENIKVVYSGR